MALLGWKICVSLEMQPNGRSFCSKLEKGVRKWTRMDGLSCRGRFWLQDLIDDVFEGIYDQPDYLNKRAILCPKNKDVNSINNTILDRMASEEKIYHSIDTDSPVDDLRYPDEFLHTLEPSGFPPHRLRLKLGCIVILLRNLNVGQGLCNGTRFQVVGFTRNLLVYRFINGSRSGQRVLIPRISLLCGKAIGIPLSRRQFPVKLAFAMSITKSQGQSLEKVGVSLKEPVFSHGMLYVALSRCTSMAGIRVETMPTDGTRAVNMVEQSVL